MKYIIAHDVGTQSNKAVLIGIDGKVYDSSEHGYEIILPKPGWAEQNPNDYWSAVCYTTNQLVSKSVVRKNNIIAMVFSTQSMGIIPVDQNGEILYNNISWVDARASIQSKKMMSRFLGKSVFKKITGVELSGKDVIPKLLWFKELENCLYKKTHKFLDVNGFLKYKCTGKMVTEWSGACSYGFNLDKKDWERLFFKVAGIDVGKLPDLVKSTDLIGHLTEKASAELGLSTAVKIYGGCDDTQSAAIGSGQIADHQAHLYLGTSAWVGISTEKNYKFKRGIASLQSADPKHSLLVGITESAGVNVEWALNKLYKKEKNEGICIYKVMEEEVDATPAGADDLIFTPWFQGERTPITDTTTRSTIFNLGLEHTRGHIMCALLEGIGYNLRWTIENIRKDYGIDIKELVVIGGGSKNNSWLQSLSDILEIDLKTTKHPKMSGAIGCAMTALVGLGIEKDFSIVQEINTINKVFKPRLKNRKIYQEMYQNYKTVYTQLKTSYQTINAKRFNS
ncbi:xylulokinase [Aquimarina sp. 2304DJ70-9]|uniref:xylulokinase n=1 Tax=Aquimarina penaris TaxID=3231044 RepID=UPI0034622A21